MKPLLRVVLVVNALIFLAFGVLFLLSPWGSLWESMHLVRVQPPLIGQLLGVALIGFAWLGFHAAIDGALTATAARVSGHVEWLSGLILIVWLGLRMSDVTGFGQLLGALIGAALLILGLGSVRLSGAVRRRERAAIAGAAAAERAEKQAAKTRAEERAAGTPVRPPMTSDPVAPANPRWDTEPVVGEAVRPSSSARPAANAAFDPATGHAIGPATGRSLDPVTGRAFEPVSSGHKIDPETGRAIDPVTGQAIDPVTGATIRRDPH
ncbi:hypothetical protein AX768_05870 [Burkholderia sp. PAMC 28687]|uniref:hypothetical protein n=1 Tax=Burkholderia sp. PAMC 28687 TaxID=1795874 RepID=UPI00078515C0|nr:hypothetical protein [Burkholderia sp. PAMC 28687]AMM13698.1 hypothetical protein AX768_05870 [Burkholderia sp. PAMC 28687]